MSWKARTRRPRTAARKVHRSRARHRRVRTSAICRAPALWEPNDFSNKATSPVALAIFGTRHPSARHGGAAAGHRSECALKRCACASPRGDRARWCGSACRASRRARSCLRANPTYWDAAQDPSKGLRRARRRVARPDLHARAAQRLTSLAVECIAAQSITPPTPNHTARG